MSANRTAPDMGWAGFILSIMLPMSAGYFLSYFYRNVNAPIAADLIRETGASAALLGLLTGVFFAAVVPSQLPLGAALDRFGPRRVQSLLLAIAAGGAAVFATAHSPFGLLAGRFLIGLGMAASLNSGLKATMLWAGRSRHLPLLNGLFVMSGGLGAMAATVPLAHAAATFGWRTVFAGLTAATALLAVLTWLLVPEPPAATTKTQGGLRGHPGNPWLFAYAPMSALTFGTISALLGLWAARWFADVEGLPAEAIATHLLVMAAALTAGAPLLGLIAAKLRPAVGAGALAMGCALLAVALELAICLHLPVPGLGLWAVLALLGAIPVLGYAVLAELYPPELIARANAVLNMAHTGAVFAVQYGIGLIVSCWPRTSGTYPASAYEWAIMTMAALQALAILGYGARRLAASGPLGVTAPRLPAVGDLS